MTSKFELGDTGTKYQFKYYTVKLNMTTWHWQGGDGSPAAVANDAIEQWVISTFGPEFAWTVADRIWWSSEKRYYFLHESDRTMFLLRWE